MQQDGPDLDDALEGGSLPASDATRAARQAQYAERRARLMRSAAAQEQPATAPAPAPQQPLVGNAVGPDGTVKMKAPAGAGLGSRGAVAASKKHE